MNKLLFFVLTFILCPSVLFADNTPYNYDPLDKYPSGYFSVWRWYGLDNSKQLMSVMRWDTGNTVTVYSFIRNTTYVEFAKNVREDCSGNTLSVVVWRDLSGNNRNLQMSTGGGTYVKVILNGRNGWPLLRFPGSVAATGTIALSFVTAGEKTIISSFAPTGGSPTSALVRTLPGIPYCPAYFGIVRGVVGVDDNIWVFNNDGTEDAIGTTYTIGTWYCAAIQHTGGALNFYLDAALVTGSPVSSGNTSSLMTTVSIGSAPSTWFVGDVQTVAIYKYALSFVDIMIETEFQTYGPESTPRPFKNKWYPTTYFWREE